MPIRPLLICLLLAMAGAAPLLAQSEHTFLKVFPTVKRGYTLCPAGDGNLYVGGAVIGRTALLKITPDGDVLSSDFLDFATGNLDNVSELLVDTDGMVVGCGTQGTEDLRRGFVFRYNPLTKTILWARMLEDELLTLNGLLEKSPGGDYLVYGEVFTITGASSDALLLQIDRNTGSLAPPLAKSFHLGKKESFNALVAHGQALYAVGRASNGTSIFNDFYVHPALSRLDTATGLPTWTRLSGAPLPAPAQLRGRDLILDSNALVTTYSGSATDPSLSTTNFFLQKHRLDGTLEWVRKYDLTEWNNEVAEELIRVADGYIIYGQASNGQGNSLFVMKTDTAGNPLWANKLHYGLNDGFAQSESQQGQIITLGNGLFFTATTEQANGVSRMLLVKTRLDGTMSDSCSAYEPTSVLLSSATALNNAPVTLQTANTAFPPLEAPHVTALSFTATVETICQTNMVVPLICDDTLDLGPDIILCQDSTVTFHAGGGYGSYLWQDGSTDSTYTTSLYDLYWVEVTDSCGEKQRDSVLLTVSLLADTQFPDTVLCSGETLTYTVSGFDAYLWTPAAALSCDTCATVVLQPAVTTQYTLYATTTDGCVLRDTFEVAVLPLLIRTEVIEFAPGDTVTLDGTPYTQPATVIVTLPATVGCDTVVTYLLQLQTMITIDCPNDLTVSVLAGEPGTVVDYGFPSVVTTCPDTSVTYTLLSGLPIGAIFPVGITEVCYRITDVCGNVDTCCFLLTVVEQAPACDVKTTGCVRYELLSIQLDAFNNRRYAIRVTNNCADALLYTAFELPGSITAVAPADGSVYTAASGRSYDVRNPNASPFHSIRFKAKTGVLLNLGASDIFRYTLPNLSAPQYIHVTARLASGQFFPAILNTFYCPVQPYPNFASGPGTERAVKSLAVYPNPTDGVLIADCSSWAGQLVQIQIVNAQGQRVFHQSLTAEYAPQALGLPASLANGLYFLEVQAAGEQRSVQRFVVQR